VTLLSQAFALFVVAALLAWRTRVRGPRAGIRGALVAGVAAVLAFTALGTLWSAGHGLWVQRRNASHLSPASVLVSPGAGAGANIAFVEWLDRTLPRHARFYLVSGPNGARDPATYQWATYRLFPRVATDDPKKAQWIVFHATTVEGAGFKRSDFSRVLQFGDKLLLAERRA
jgi:hypothetical protein